MMARKLISSLKYEFNFKPGKNEKKTKQIN